MNAQDVMTLVAAGGSGLGGIALKSVFDWATSRKARKKVALKLEAEAAQKQSEAGKFDADAVAAITSAAVTLVGPLKTEVAELTARVATLESEKNITNSRLALAIEYIRSLRTWITTRIADETPPQPPVDLGL